MLKELVKISKSGLIYTKSKIHFPLWIAARTSPLAMTEKRLTQTQTPLAMTMLFFRHCEAL